MKLSPEHLIHRVQSAHLTLDPIDDADTNILGQPRATTALEFGIDIKQPGYNLYLAGENGTGRMRYVMEYLEPIAKRQVTPPDWLYVNNFDNPGEPRAIELPHQQGIKFKRDIDELIEALIATFPIVFENPTYLQKKTALQRAFDQIYDQAVVVVERKAAEYQVAVYREEGSITFTPLIDGQPADETSFAAMSDEEREKFRRDTEELEGLLNDVLLELPQWQRDLNDQLHQLRHSVITQSLKPLFDDLQQKYQGNAGVLLYLAQTNNHLVRFVDENMGDTESGESENSASLRVLLEHTFSPNLVISSSADKGAPIVLESNPSYTNLFGRVVYSADQTGITTNYQMIMPGALLRANGGYLLLDIEKVLRDPATWDALKRSLRDGKIYIEPPAMEFQIGQPNTLKPDPIPLDTKVILIGPSEVYYTLEQYDTDFDELFRVLVEFTGDIERSPQNLHDLEKRLRQYARNVGITELSDGALARLAEYASRIAEHQNKLTARIDLILEIAVEADHCRVQEGASIVEAEHIDAAIIARDQRNARLRDRIQEDILAGTVVIPTDGKAAGQVNGLSVIQVGESSYGCPIRITASAHPGSSGVVDIEREVKLGQALHSKGILLLAGYLCSRYAKEFPLVISARIAMEQSYGFIDGDSASLAELCALLSTLAEVELRQDVALTGSVNQCGEVQAIGGVNEKIEGYFDICCARGLTGQQGVIIPAINQINLMLADRVIEAVEQNIFSIHVVETVDEAMKILCGKSPGKENAKGKFPANSINAQIIKRLKEFTKFIHPGSNL